MVYMCIAVASLILRGYVRLMCVNHCGTGLLLKRHSYTIFTASAQQRSCASLVSDSVLDRVLGIDCLVLDCAGGVFDGILGLSCLVLDLAAQAVV